MDYQYLVFARALHIIAVVFWIGGVAFVTTVLIPAIRSSQKPEGQYLKDQHLLIPSHLYYLIHYFHLLSLSQVFLIRNLSI